MSGCICGNGKGWYPTEDGREKYCTCSAAARAMIRDGVMRIRSRGALHLHPRAAWSAVRRGDSAPASARRVSIPGRALSKSSNHMSYSHLLHYAGQMEIIGEIAAERVATWGRWGT